MTGPLQKDIPAGRIAVPPMPKPQMGSAAFALTPKDIWGIIRRHLLLIIILSILGLMAGGVSWYLLKRYAPKYTAQTFIRVLPETDPTRILNPIVNKDIQYGYRHSIASLIRGQNTLSKLLDSTVVQETKWFKSFGDIRDIRFRKAIKKLKKNLSVSAMRDAEFVSLSMTCGSAQESAKIVNQMVRMFIAMQGGNEQQSVGEKLSTLRAQQTDLLNELNLAERELDEITRSSGFTDLTTDRNNFRDTVTLKLDNLVIEHDDLSLQIKELEGVIKTLVRRAEGPINIQIENEIETDPIMLNLYQQLASLEAAIAGQLTKFGEEHPEVQRTQEFFNEIRNTRELRKVQIAEQVRQSDLRNAQDQLLVLTDKMEELQNLRRAASLKQEDLDRARTQYERQASMRDERKARLEECKQLIEQWTLKYDDPKTSKLEYIGDAPIPLEVSFPKWQMLFPAGLMLGMMLGVGLSFLVELLNDLVRTPRDIMRHLHIPLLGIIPDAEEDNEVEDVDLYNVVRLAPYSMISECYRKFRVNLKMSKHGQSAKALLISSAFASEGKTSIAANLAMTFIAENRRVLIVDVNFRRPHLQKVFASVQEEAVEIAETGLSSFLMGVCSEEDIIKPSPVDGLDVVYCGQLPSNPAELLGNERMQTFIEQQKANYDYVIIDGPPLLVVSDGKVLSKLAEGIILVFNAETTKRGAAQRTISELKQIDASLIGGVLLKVKSIKGGYFREQMRYYRDYQKPLLAQSV